MSISKITHEKPNRRVALYKSALTVSTLPQVREVQRRASGLVVHPLSLKQVWPHLLLVFAVVLTVYAYTTPRFIALEDDGEFAAAAYFLGVAHPPGYPLFVLLVHPFTWLPVGSIAFRVHLASAVFGAATCAVLWWCVRTLLSNLTAAYVAALALGFSRVFWSQAIIADVYTLNTLLFFLVFACGLAYLHAQRRLFLRLMVLLFSLSLANHWPLIVLAAPCLACLLWPARRTLLRQLPRELPWLLGMSAIGLLPYGWMVWRSQTSPELGFYGTIGSWHEFWFYVKRSGYAQVDNSLSAGWWDKVEFGAFLLREVLQQYTLLGALVAGVGIVAQWKRWGPVLSAGLIAGFASATVLLVLLLGFDYGYMSRTVFRVYPLIPYGIMALWLALGFDHMMTALQRQNRRFGRPAACVVGVVLVGLPLLMHRDLNNRRNYVFAHDYATTMMGRFEPHATVLTHGDANAFVLSYYHFVEGLRPDIKLLNDEGLGIALDGRLFKSIELSPALKREVIENYVKSTANPVYFFAFEPRSMSDEDYGFFKKMKKTNKKVAVSEIHIDPELLKFYRRIVLADYTDEWTIKFRDQRVYKMSWILSSLLYLHPQRNLYARYQPDLDNASNNFLGLLSKIRLLKTYEGATPYQILEWIEKAETMVNQTIGKREHAVLYFFKGQILMKMGRTDQAVTAFNRSLAIYPHPENLSKGELAKLGVWKAER